MNHAPILILQMQRMGDLVLSFPLMGWLGARFPGHPLWVIGERHFFEPLMPLSPPATYFSYDRLPALPDRFGQAEQRYSAGEGRQNPQARGEAGGQFEKLRQIRFHAIINLSHRAQAAALAGALRSDALIGPWMNADGDLFINGDWQLYRASLTANNRYNRYHWADLNALDIIPPSIMQRTLWPKPRTNAAPGRARPSRVGLFLGASEAAKHPDAAFWSELARLLLQAGLRPVLLGGEAERGLGHAVALNLGSPALNLCGNFTISELARFIAELDLFVCPDTGPMHVAVWSATPTLNLSMGPVSPWETGPSAPGHHVLRAALPCAGCWTCTAE
ncbi:glycosyltransferase family 9 protein, partial [Desulfovibrio sp. OttesenSCG-928-A18]|nr:glycosyltransferase family 9 protein [Desulfovibrio sp. OttesenSCG-928-A18]